MADETPWYARDEWTPPGVRQSAIDARLANQLRDWTRGAPLTPGLPHLPGDEDREGGTLWIGYSDSYRPSFAVSARQRVTDRDVAVFGYSSLVDALNDCIEMARDYERDDLLDLAPPGLA